MEAEWRADVIVVGAGTAGCVVASRLSEDSGRRVLLLEAGGDGPTAAQKSRSFFDAAAEVGRTWPDLATRGVPGQPVRRYIAGRGIGGSSAVNAMVALTGDPADYDRWRDDHGCTGWAWRDVAAAFEALPVPRRELPSGEWGPVGGALAACGGEAARLTIDPSGARAHLADVYLGQARMRPNLLIHTHSQVERIEIDHSRTIGVRLADGRGISAGRVVLCAGALRTPRLLMQSGIVGLPVGLRLKDHPAVAFALTLRPDAVSPPDSHAVTTILRSSSSAGVGDLQVVGLNHLGRHGARSLGVVMVSVMAVHSSGRLTRDTIDLGSLTDERDRTAMRDGVRLLVALTTRPAFDAIATSVSCDDRGTPAATLDALDDAELDRWIASNAVGHFHAACTCPMGPVDDESAVVDLAGRVRGVTGLSVCDASVFPDLPAPVR